MQIALGGDVFLGGDLVSSEETNIIDHPRYLSADLRIVNLEQAISNSAIEENKCTLHTGSAAAVKLLALNVTAVNLANNHIQDKGLAGIGETRSHLDAGGIGHFGAGATIAEARQPYWVTDELALLGYCDYDRSYLKRVAVAGLASPGVSPLRVTDVYADLDLLPKGKKAILYFHWGREHVLFPSRRDVEIARRLLEDNRVALIVGMHAHVVQGYVEHKGKRAYMCIGNLLFPNFYISPPTRIVHPAERAPDATITRRYHQVYKLTYKKWRIINRVSLLLVFDTETGLVKHFPTFQDDVNPHTGEAPWYLKYFSCMVVEALSVLYNLPQPIYKCLAAANSVFGSIALRVHNALFAFRQMGFVFVIRKALLRVFGK